MVRLKGLEPSRPKTPDPKSGASTNSATSALVAAKIVKNGETGKILCDFYDPHRPMQMLVTTDADGRTLLLLFFDELLHLCLVCLCLQEEVPLVAGACEVVVGILALPVVVAREIVP